MKKKIRYLLYILISFLLSTLILTLSENQTNWHYFWRLIKVPSMWPAFADIDHIFQSISCKLIGIDLFIDNPCDEILREEITSKQIIEKAYRFIGQQPKGISLPVYAKGLKQFLSQFYGGGDASGLNVTVFCLSGS